MSIRDAPTIRDLIHNLAELFPLHTHGAIVGMADDAGEILLTFELSADVHSSHRQVVELGFGLVVGEIRRHSPGWQPLHLAFRSEAHTSELQSLMRISYAVFCLHPKQLTHRSHLLP